MSQSAITRKGCTTRIATCSSGSTSSTALPALGLDRFANPMDVRHGAGTEAAARGAAGARRRWYVLGSEVSALPLGDMEVLSRNGHGREGREEEE